MMPNLQAKMRRQAARELRAFEYQMEHPGSYRYLCMVGGIPMWTHQPVGPVLRTVP